MSLWRHILFFHIHLTLHGCFTGNPSSVKACTRVSGDVPTHPMSAYNTHRVCIFWRACSTCPCSFVCWGMCRKQINLGGSVDMVFFVQNATCEYFLRKYVNDFLHFLSSSTSASRYHILAITLPSLPIPNYSQLTWHSICTDQRSKDTKEWTHFFGHINSSPSFRGLNEKKDRSWTPRDSRAIEQDYWTKELSVPLYTPHSWFLHRRARKRAA